MSETIPTQELVIGCGSIGDRHAHVLRNLGVRITLIDTRPERAREIASRYGNATWLANLQEAHLEQFDAAIIAIPANSHVPLGQVCGMRGFTCL